MLRIVEGVPGSGKTYYAVHYLAKFFSYDKVYMEFFPVEDVLVVTNIDALKLPHEPLGEYIQKYGVEKVFTVNFWESKRKKYKKVIIIVDEAQRYFDRSFRNKDVFFFFQYHRHIGVDIFLLTQDRKLLPRDILSMAENVIRAKPRSVSAFSFVYEVLSTSTGERYQVITLRKKKEVFDMYSSFKYEEGEKPKNYALRWIVVSALVFVFSVSFFAFSILNFWGSDKDSDVKQVHQQVHQKKKQDKAVKPVQTQLVPTPSPSVPASVYEYKLKAYMYIEDTTGRSTLSFIADDGKLYKDVSGTCRIDGMSVVCSIEPRLVF